MLGQWRRRLGDRAAERETNGEWAFLTVDLDATCTECRQPLRAGQAVGHLRAGVVHAKCFKSEPAV